MLSRPSPSRCLAGALLGATVILGAAGAAQAQALPTPLELASSLDLECYRTPGPALDLELALTHLNPVLHDLGLPAHKVIIRELAQTCVPVTKNNHQPAEAAAPFVRHIDFACYRIDAAPLPAPVPLELTHLNPELAYLPQHRVDLVRPAQLCVPVSKNNTPPPAEIRAFVQYLDLECYTTDPGPHPAFAVWLTQLNPQLQSIAPHWMSLVPEPRQLCVPVRKNAQEIPQPFLKRIERIDLEKFRASPTVPIPATSVVLHHLNPLLVDRPAISVVLDEASSLLVPVAKNGAIPGSD
jgi:hypothetical protein